MGQKVHPTGFRLGIAADWTAKWYAEGSEYMNTLTYDLKIRRFLRRHLSHASVSRIQIERQSNLIHIVIHTARPGIVIGKKGEDIESLRVKISELIGCGVNSVRINIEEIRKPEIDANLVAEGIANQLVRRIMFRRAMKRAMQNAMRLGAKGIKVAVSGRLNSAEIARSERYHEGQVPLHTLSANIDYGFAEANTTYGIIGVKVWIYKGKSDMHAKSRQALGVLNPADGS